ncbi:hypothetical protein Hanom_Chr12g01069111 [Helianthus anomalus]
MHTSHYSYIINTMIVLKKPIGFSNTTEISTMSCRVMSSMCCFSCKKNLEWG